MKSGFTLVEVLVALVVLEVGLLGVVGTLLLAARHLDEAQALEGAATVMERTYEELREGLPSGEGTASGREVVPGGEVRWEVLGGDMFRVEFIPEARLPPSTVYGASPPGSFP